jgi:hypothetical protein
MLDVANGFWLFWLKSKTLFLVEKHWQKVEKQSQVGFF